MQLETRYSLRVLVARDDALIPPAFRLERLRAYGPADAAVSPTPPLTQALHIDEEEVEDEIEQAAETAESDLPEQPGEEERGRSRRRRRRRRRREEEPVSASAARSEADGDVGESTGELTPVNARAGGEGGNGEEENAAEGLRRRRGRRGGRRRGRRESDLEPIFAEPRPPSDIIQILPGSDVPGSDVPGSDVPGFDVEKLEPAPMTGHASTGQVISSVEIEVARANGPQTPEPVIAPEEMAGEVPGEITDLAAPRDHSITARSVEARPAAEAAPLTEQELTSTSESERTSEAGFSGGPLPAEPEHPVEPGTEKSSTPRRGWWQRLIQP